MGTKFEHLVGLFIISSLMLLAGLFVLTKFNTLFKTYIRSELLRRNVVVWLASVCLSFSITPVSGEFYEHFSTGQGVFRYFIIQLLGGSCLVLIVFNIAWYVAHSLWIKKLSFRVGMGILLFTIIISTMVVGAGLNYLGNHGSFKQLEYNILFNFYSASVAGLTLIMMNYADLDRKRILNEKELEVTRLRELKTKAELDALHSKINPHFLYNALNSIADLSVTDGRKARKMTIALADLFRYSINYSNHNYSTVREEVEMAEVYLQIEKIRFEDQLNYSVADTDDVDHYLVPRFVLQPIVENAVKHGLKATGKMTQIDIEVKKDGDGLVMMVTDNGPAFPAELNPGYGVKSIYDKLDLLFPGAYEVHFANQPRKSVSIHVHKLLKNEPGV